MLDLRYEARDIDQSLTSQDKIDQWFEAKTKGLTDLAKAQLKKRWGTMQKVLSVRVAAGADRRRHPAWTWRRETALIERPRQRHAGRRQHLPGLQVLRAVRQDGPQGQVRDRHLLRAQRRPTSRARRRGEGETEKLRQYDIYRQMLAD